MTITTRFGEMDINENDIITFPNGIYGFEEIKEYIILKMDKESPFLWMQSVKDNDLTFVLIDPRIFVKDYILDVSDRIDSVVLNKVLGIPIFLALIWLTFQLGFALGNPIADWIDALLIERAVRGNLFCPTKQHIYKPL